MYEGVRNTYECVSCKDHWTDLSRRVVDWPPDICWKCREGYMHMSRFAKDPYWVLGQWISRNDVEAEHRHRVDAHESLVEDAVAESGRQAELAADGARSIAKVSSSTWLARLGLDRPWKRALPLALVALSIGFFVRGMGPGVTLAVIGSLTWYGQLRAQRDGEVLWGPAILLAGVALADPLLGGLATVGLLLCHHLLKTRPQRVHNNVYNRVKQQVWAENDPGPAPPTPTQLYRALSVKMREGSLLFAVDGEPRTLPPHAVQVVEEARRQAEFRAEEERRLARRDEIRRQSQEARRKRAERNAVRTAILNPAHDRARRVFKVLKGSGRPHPCWNDLEASMSALAKGRWSEWDEYLDMARARLRRRPTCPHAPSAVEALAELGQKARTAVEAALTAHDRGELAAG